MKERSKVWKKTWNWRDKLPSIMRATSLEWVICLRSYRHKWKCLARYFLFSASNTQCLGWCRFDQMCKKYRSLDTRLPEIILGLQKIFNTILVNNWNLHSLQFIGANVKYLNAKIWFFCSFQHQIGKLPRSVETRQDAVSVGPVNFVFFLRPWFH